MSEDFEVDKKLLAEAQDLGQHGTKQETSTAALNEYIARRKQLKIVEMFGTVEYDSAYDYKQGRRTRKTMPRRNEH